MSIWPSQLSLFLDESDAQLQSLLRTLDNRRYVIRSLVPKGYEPYFKEQARFISAHTSTAIEGNPLDEGAAFRVMVEGADSEDPAQVEKVNLEEAYQYVELLASDKSVKVDEGLIRTFNSISLRGLPDARNRGRYRVLQNAIVDSATREVRYMPPPPEAVPRLMADYVQRVNEWRSAYPAPFAAALAHFGLISVHPFDDGNGRTARLVADLLLGLTGWSVEGMLSINPLLLENRAGYYNALREAQGEGFVEELDVTPFVAFHTEQLMNAAVRLEERAIAFNRQRDAWVAQFSFLTMRQVTALMFMRDIGPLSSSRFAALTDTSQATALTDLGEMLKAGLVARQGAGRNTRYRFAGPTA
jgi:Fic family protein